MPPITFFSQVRRLSGFMFSGDARGSSGPGLLFVHGLDSRQDGYWARAEIASAKLGATAVTFDLGGHGQSARTPDDLSIRDHLADVTAAYDRLLEEVAVTRIASASAEPATAATSPRC